MAKDIASETVQRTGGQILVDQLRIHGTDTVYCVPGESYLEVLDALHDAGNAIRLVNARHEAGAANMADAYGKLTGQPGICMVTRGPGACQASVGIHTAMQDSTPLIMLVGQVGRDMLDREAFQEIDYRRMFGTVAKWAAQIDVTERIPEYIDRAFRVATSGRPGPVVLALPEDMLRESAAVADARPYRATRAALADADVQEMTALLRQAKRPMLVAGGSGWSDAACAALTRFAEVNNLPATTSFRRQDVIDNRSSAYLGDFGTAAPKALVDRLKSADCVLVLGARMGEMTSKGYTAIGGEEGQKIIHIHNDPDEIGRTFTPDLGLTASPDAVARALGDLDLGRASDWAEWCREGREAYLADIQPPAYDGSPLDLGAAFAALRDELPEDFICTLDAGNHTGWPQRFLQFHRPGREVGSTAGAMGYSVPAAVAASIRHPDRVVISCVGDGGFMMSGQEIAAARQHGGRPIVFVFNNNMYGTIRMHQEQRHPNRVSGTDLENPDFCAMGRAMGAHAEYVEKTEDFLPAFRRARDSGLPAVIELRTDPQQISTRARMDQLRPEA
jgi:acetolactate synthase-1/2/3 large subunit